MLMATKSVLVLWQWPLATGAVLFYPVHWIYHEAFGARMSVPRAFDYFVLCLCAKRFPLSCAFVLLTLLLLLQDIRRIVRNDARIMNKLHRRVFLDKIGLEDVKMYISFYVEASNRDAFMAVKQVSSCT